MNKPPIKIKVELSKGQTRADVDALFKKAAKVGSVCSEGERYTDDVLNDFRDMICERHSKLASEIEKEVKELLKQEFTKTRT